MSNKQGERPPRRGRPPLVSRQAIFRSALEVIQKLGIEAATVARISDDLGVTPKTIYHHVTGREEILDGVVELIFSDLVVVVPVDASWRDQAFAWAAAVHEHVATCPNAAPLHVSGGRISVAWIACVGQLARILAQAGLPDDVYARSVQSITHLAVAFPLAAHFTTAAQPAESIYAAVGTSEQPDQEHLLRLARSIAPDSGSFEFVLNATLDVIERISIQ